LIRRFLGRCYGSRSAPVVHECMALRPRFQSLTETHMVRSTHGVITNARADHLDVMGPTSADVALALAGSAPIKGRLFTAERQHFDILANAAQDRRSSYQKLFAEEVGCATNEALSQSRATTWVTGMVPGTSPPALVEAAVERVERAGGRVGYHGADMSRPDQIEQMMAYARTELGGVDILINNAGIQHVAPVDEFPAERWDAVLAINLTAAFHTTRLALQMMRARNWGRIINIASVHGLVASANKAAYVAAKHGLIGLTKVIALETARTGITCNALCPGWVLTPLVERQVQDRAVRDGIDDDAARQALLLEKQPSGDFVSPEQLAATAAFLCSEAASQVRGAAWNVDGGWTAQ